MIYDSTGTEIVSAAMALESNQSKQLEIQIDCAKDYFLRAETVQNVTIEGRHSDTAGWTNLETGAIDLTPWADTAQTFFIRVTADTVAQYDQAAFMLTVSV